MPQILFEGKDWEEIKLKILKFAAEELKLVMQTKQFRPGRPKMTPEEHLALPKIRKKRTCFDKSLPPPDITEAETIKWLERVYEECGPTAALNIIKKFNVERFRQVPPKHWGIFIGFCDDTLKAHQQKKSEP